MTARPLVSIVTPVYNGGPYLAQAIDSVLAQSYAHWEYVIVNNLSTDETLEIAERYARRDRRIRVVTNEVFVDCESNHNNGFRLISPDSKYCKVVSADDWLLPGALARFVEFAVQHPTVGIVGSYQRSGDEIRWTGLRPDEEVIAGREICRRALLNDVNVFGNPTSVLYRADIVRRTSAFFPHSRPHADTSACFANLHDCDFGFIHDVLTVERVHENRVSSSAERLNAGDLALLETLLEYGPIYLSEEELRKRRAEVEALYYETVARGLLRLGGREYFEYHDAGLRRLGLRLEKSRIATAVFRKVASESLRPLTALRKVKSALAGRRTALLS